MKEEELSIHKGVREGRPEEKAFETWEKVNSKSLTQKSTISFGPLNLEQRVSTYEK